MSTAPPIVVVGARCGGAATAMLLARLGHRVTVVDRATFPSDTLSTHCLSRAAVVQLVRWGLHRQVLDSGAPALTRVRIEVDDEVIDRRIRCRSGVDHLVAPRRHVLDQILLEAAAEAGAEVRTGVTVTGVTWSGDRVTGVEGRDGAGRPVHLPARFVVGADGLRSRIARAVSAPLVDVRPPGGACHYSYYRGPDWGDAVQFFVADRLMAGIFPTHGGEAVVWTCGPAQAGALAGPDRERALLARIARASTALAELVAGAERTAPVRGAIGLPNHIRQAWGPGWALVGDAGMHRDPVTGHGITDAFRDAELVARALHDALTGVVSENEAGRRFARLRHELSAEIFDATVRMSQYPGREEFTAQHLRANAAVEEEARFLAELPEPVAVAA